MSLTINAQSFFNGIHDGYVYNVATFVGVFIGNVIYYNWLPNYRSQYKYIVGPSTATTIFIAYYINNSPIPPSTNNFFYLFGSMIPTFYTFRTAWLLRNL